MPQRPRQAKYQLVHDDLRLRILSGEWAVGEQIPTISALQDQYDIRSLSTVRTAQQLLVDEGLLETRQGSGAFVKATAPRRRPDGRPTYARIALGVRIEFYRDARITGALTREDLDAVTIPAVGEWFGPASLGDLISEIAGLYLEIEKVEHYPSRPHIDTSGPLAVAVCRAREDYALAEHHEQNLRSEGWHLSKVNVP